MPDRRLRCAAIWVLSACAPAIAGAQSGTCLPADTHSGKLVQYLDSLVTSNSAHYAEGRDSLNLSKTTSSKVVFVSSGSNCALAAEALDLRLGTGPTVRSVYVVKLNTNFAVEDPTLRDGENRRIFFFSKNWVYLSNLSVF